jgi:hypothetical protein
MKLLKRFFVLNRLWKNNNIIKGLFHMAKAKPTITNIASFDKTGW